MSIDPLAAFGGQDSWSPYAAMGSNPAMMVDPDGLISGESHYLPSYSLLEPFRFSYFVMGKGKIDNDIKDIFDAETARQLYWSRVMDNYKRAMGEGNGTESEHTRNYEPQSGNKNNLPPGVFPISAADAVEAHGVPTGGYFVNPESSGETAYVIRENDEDGIPIPIEPGQFYIYRIEGAATRTGGVYKVPDFGSAYVDNKGYVQPVGIMMKIHSAIGMDMGLKDANWIRQRETAGDMKWVRLYNMVR